MQHATTAVVGKGVTKLDGPRASPPQLPPRPRAVQGKRSSLLLTEVTWMEVPGWKAKKTTKETVQRPSPPPPTEAALRATVQQGKAKDEAKELKPHLECPSSPMTVAITMTVPWGGGGGG